MGLLEEIAGERKRPAVRCSVARALDALDEQEADELRAALADPETYTGAQISRALARRGMRTPQQQVQRHRAGHCGCV